MEMPETKTIATILAGCIMAVASVGQFFGLTMPNMQRADANKEARYSCLDALDEANDERKDHQNRYHPPELLP